VTRGNSSPAAGGNNGSPKAALDVGARAVAAPESPLVHCRSRGRDRTQSVTRRRFVARLFRWHADARRPLLIREAENPWEVLVAEVMSQQTGIERVGPAWRRFVDRWPTPHDLSEAGMHELLAAWTGLGYNRRALALREAARKIVAEHGGRVPATVAALDRLPGIGAYTARAVAAAAFGVPVAPLDVNVRRVVSRVLGIPSASPGLQAAADDLVSRGEPARWVDAVMDLASGTCSPRAPHCNACPLASICASQGAVVASEPVARTVPFPATTRWLRGRLVAMINDVSPDTWVALPDRMGHHETDAITTAARGLERDGFIDLRSGEARLRP
jgi:A/G-specific adenine glycosylase